MNDINHYVTYIQYSKRLLDERITKATPRARSLMLARVHLQLRTIKVQQQLVGGRQCRALKMCRQYNM
jgi:hypothetical protein